MDYSKVVGPRHKQSKAHQMERAHEDQIKNHAGGYVFQVSDFDRLDRFLILGVECNTYYQSAKALVRENAKNIEKLIQKDGVSVVNRVVEISNAGRAAKNDPALFVLAMAAGLGNADTRKAALNALPKVARIGTHLFHFAQYVEGFRGWGRGLRRAVADWYNQKDLVNLQYQLMKYQQRDGWSHRDLLRLSHPKANSDTRNALYQWVVDKSKVELIKHPDLHRLRAAEYCLTSTDTKEVIRLIQEYNLPREVVNTSLLNDRGVWTALLEKMPITAMIRNLGKMSSIGLLEPLSDAALKVENTLTNEEILRKGRVHPLTLLSALKTYGQGHGVKGNLSWVINGNIVSALENAFYTSFKTIEPTGKKWLLGVDVSASMTCGNIAGIPNVVPAEAAAVMAMVTARVEQQSVIMGFSHQFINLGIKRNDPLDVVCKKVQNHIFGGTNCALAIEYALKKRMPVDAFMILTDNETWQGGIHVHQILNQYRNQMGIPSKLVVIGFTATDCTIGDPNDKGTINFAGFDAACPSLIADFVRG